MGFRNRLILFLIVTLISVQALTVMSAYGVVRQNLIERGRGDLAATSDAFMRQLRLLSERVSDGVQVLALDFPLRQAIAEKNRETALSALRNHGRRIGASRMFLVGLDGAVDIDTQDARGNARAFPFQDLLDKAARDGRAMGLAALDGEVFWIVTVPVNAPLPIAFIAAGVPVDDALIEKLRQVSVVPATIALALQQHDGSYAPAARAQAAGRMHLPGADALSFGEASLVEDDGQEFLTLATRLQTARKSSPVIAVFDYPLQEALGPFYDVAVPVGIALVLGLAIAILGAALIARGVSRPLESLAETARRIEGGDYTAPPVRKEDGEIGQLSDAIAHMVAAVAERQEALAVARDDAVRANAAKSDFLANMSHELRTPLNAVIGFADMIQGQLLGPIGNDRYLQYARDIRNSGAHLLSLVEEVLSLSKVEAGTLSIERQKTAPGDVLKDVLPIVKATAEARKVTVSVDGDPEVWPAIDADPVRVGQVLVSLLSNAVKFTSEGGQVRIAAEASDGLLVLRVSDNGIGISAEDLPRVTQPFYRVSSAFDGSYQGAGLGLALTKAIVDLHGGRLSIASAPGQGTTVSVGWPLHAVSGRARKQDAA